MIYTVTNEVDFSRDSRRQSLPLFKGTLESPKSRMRKRSRRKSSIRPTKISDGKITAENVWAKNTAEIPGFLRTTSSR